jgi:hypothetical protein
MRWTLAVALVAALIACHGSTSGAPPACGDASECGDAGPSNPPACPAATGTAVCNTPCPEAGLGGNYEQLGLGLTCVRAASSGDAPSGDAGLVWGCSI